MAKDLVKNESPLVSNSGQFENYMDTNKFEHTWRIANMFSQSTMVPDQYKNNPNNCMIAFNMATRLQIDPIMLMQKTYMIHGKPGMEGQLVIALVNARGPFKGPIQWEFSGEGKSRSCTAFAVHETTGDRCEATVTWKMVELEKWHTKAGSKWLTIPDMMFKYRSAVFLARSYCPEVMLGFMTVEELQDVGVSHETSEEDVSSIDSLIGSNEGNRKPVEASVVEPIPEVEIEETAPEDVQQPIQEDENTECRFLCNKCSHESDDFKEIKIKGKFVGWKCSKCFSADTIDRHNG